MLFIRWIFFKDINDFFFLVIILSLIDCLFQMISSSIQELWHWIIKHHYFFLLLCLWLFFVLLFFLILPKQIMSWITLKKLSLISTLLWEEWTQRFLIKFMQIMILYKFLTLLITLILNSFLLLFLFISNVLEQFLEFNIEIFPTKYHIDSNINSQ